MQTLALILLLVLNANAQGLQILGSRAYAGNEVAKPVFVEVRVRNTSDQELDGFVYYRFVPQRPSGYVIHEGVDMYSPWEGEVAVGPLKPQEMRKVVFQTLYFSPNTFSTTTGSFRVDPLVPFVGRSSGPTRITYRLTTRSPDPPSSPAPPSPALK